MILLALIAIVLPLVLLMVFRLPARTTMIISMLVVAAIAFAVWQMTPLALGASALQGTHRALTIGLILFGAISRLAVRNIDGERFRFQIGIRRGSFNFS